MLRYKEIKMMIQDIAADMENGQRLPSRTKLCKRLDTSRATVDKAIAELERDGFLESHFGSGTYVARRFQGAVNDAENYCLIVPDIREDIYAGLARGVRQTTDACGVNVIVCNSESSAEKQDEYIRRMSMAGITGFIIVPVVYSSVNENANLYRSLSHAHIPFVFCNRDVEGVKAPIVKSNDFFGGYIAARHLLERGYTSIAYLSRRRYRTSVDRCQGYLSALLERSMRVDRQKMVLQSDDIARDDGYTVTRNLLTQPNPPDAVFCFNDAVAHAACRAIRDLGLRVSDDVGVIGYDNNALDAQSDPPLTSISYKTEEIGARAASLLWAMTHNQQQDAGFEYYLYQPALALRQSCLGPVNHKK